MLGFYDDILAIAYRTPWLFFLLLTIIICLLFFRREKRIKKARAKEMTMQQSLMHLELHAFRAQMDPHFIFNSLNAIHHYILTTSTDMASLYLTRFSRLMRLMIGNFNREWVNLEEDVEALELYLQLEQLRFGPQFAYRLQLMPEVSRQYTLVPPLIIQPYVQEAIWRRLLLRPQKSGGLLRVVIGREQDRLYILVEDNGICNGAAVPAPGQPAAGVTIAAQRLSMISQKYNMAASVVQQPVYNEQRQASGSRVTISMQHVSGS